MLDKKVYCLSGLQRSGSTLLGSILAQNPEVYVTPTSPLYSLLVSTNEAFNLASLQYTFDCDAVSKRTYHAMVDAFYADIKEPIIFDKERRWPNHVGAIAEFINPEPRIICTVRPIAEIIASFLKLAEQDPNNFIDTHLKYNRQEINDNNRASLLWLDYIKPLYDYMMNGLERNPENILLVDYRDLVFNPANVLKRIYKFCGMDDYQHTFDNIENRCAEEKDHMWGMKNLHDIRPKLKMVSPSPTEYLTRDAIEYFSQFDIKVAA